ncbi:MAG: sarcosine oxidase subunit gamma family protein [Paracoccaceae bacterium]|jgi:sarcosine oxidase subunit gamma|nr:sarcosine oxidase subunit gamma family protein [Paracoccaceae bacterium]
MPTLPPETLLAGRTARHGAAELSELPLVPLWWIAPFPGGEAALSRALEAAHGVPFPAQGETARSGDAEIRWAGRAQALLIGPGGADPRLAAHAAVIDVSDVYARLGLTGPDTAAVLARLVPLDLRPPRFRAGRTARTLLGHMTAQVTATPEGTELLVMRSFARTAFHDIETAMRGVAARPG